MSIESGSLCWLLFLLLVNCCFCSLHMPIYDPCTFDNNIFWLRCFVFYLAIMFPSLSLSLLCFLNLIKGMNCGRWRFSLVENCEVILILKDAMCSLCSSLFWRLKSVVGISPVPFDAIHIVWCREQELVKGY